MSAPNAEALVSMAALEALLLLRRRLASHTALSAEEMARSIQQIEAGAEGLDFDRAVAMHNIVPLVAPLEDAPLFFRTVLLALIVARGGQWARTITKGRAWFIRQLSRDEEQVFRAAGLLERLPSDDVVLWWDELNASMWGHRDAGKRSQGRQAEALTLRTEIEHLRESGIAETPEWVAIDDNTAGYDIRSFRRIGGNIEQVMIEVKSTVLSPLRYYLTRGEWERAAKNPSRYEVHVWNLSASPPVRHIRKATDIAPHIPSDSGEGRWETAALQVGAGN